MPLKTVKVDSDGDPIMKSGKQVFIYSSEAAAQIISSTLKVQLGEYRYNQKKGVEYMNNAFMGNPNYQLFEFQCRTQIKALSFVSKINSFEYELNDDVLSFNMNVSTIYGNVTVEQ